MEIIEKEIEDLVNVNCFNDMLMRISYEGLTKLASTKNVEIKDLVKFIPYTGMYIEIKNNDKDLIKLVTDNKYTKNMKIIDLPTKDILNKWGSMIFFEEPKCYENEIHDIRVYVVVN